MSLLHHKLAIVKPAPKRSRSLRKGIVAGLVGGITATAAKSIFEKLYPPRIHGKSEPPVLLAENIASHRLPGRGKTFTKKALHLGFGAAVGAAYGAAAEYYPDVTAKEGASFGMALMAMTHDGALPFLGLTPKPSAQSSREQSSELASHIVYGVTTETVRRIVRRAID